MMNVRIRVLKSFLSTVLSLKEMRCFYNILHKNKKLNVFLNRKDVVVNGHLRLDFYKTMHDFCCMRKSIQYDKCTFEKLHEIFVGTDALHFLSTIIFCFPGPFPIEYQNLHIQFLFNGNLYKHITSKSIQ